LVCGFRVLSLDLRKLRPRVELQSRRGQGESLGNGADASRAWDRDRLDPRDPFDRPLVAFWAARGLWPVDWPASVGWEPAGHEVRGARIRVRSRSVGSGSCSPSGLHLCLLRSSLGRPGFGWMGPG
jgi:hypothetical protein